MFSNFTMFTIQKFDEMHIIMDKYLYLITSLKNHLIFERRLR